MGKFKVGDYIKFSDSMRGAYRAYSGNGVYSWDNFAYDSLVNGNIFIVRSVGKGGRGADRWINIGPIATPFPINKWYYESSYSWKEVWFDEVSTLELACAKVKIAEREKKDGSGISSR